MFKKILVPLDGSEQSERIGGWACGLALGLGADIVLLGVVDPDDIEMPGYGSGYGGTGSTAAGEGPYDQPARDSTRGAAPGTDSVCAGDRRYGERAGTKHPCAPHPAD
ncbi:MAG: universal stress protein [Dehalococcoidia bacterium]|nr:universal stress protein [Dehalococcoidia bacterium]